MFLSELLTLCIEYQGLTTEAQYLLEHLVDEVAIGDVLEDTVEDVDNFLAIVEGVAIGETTIDWGLELALTRLEEYR